MKTTNTFFRYELPLPSGGTTIAAVIQRPTASGFEYAVSYRGKELGVETSLAEGEVLLFKGYKNDLFAKLAEAEKAKEFLRSLSENILRKQRYSIPSR